MSSFIELTTFTGKIGADGFKYLYWKDQPPSHKLSLIYFQRSADIIGFILIFLFFLLPWYIPTIIGTIFLITLIIKRKKITPENNTPESFLKTIKQHWFLWLVITSLSIIAYMIILTQLSLIFSTFGLTINKQLFIIFLTSHGLGAISQLPLGLGIKDFTIFYQLKQYLTQHEIILGLVWTRMFSELPAIILGGIFLGLHFKKNNKIIPKK